MSEQASAAKTASGTQASSAIHALASHPIVSRSEWLEARTALLAREKAFTKLRDQLNAEQRALPWVRIEKEYVFDGPSGKITLAQLFNGRSQLFIKHFMMGPGPNAPMRGMLIRSRPHPGLASAFRKSRSHVCSRGASPDRRN